MRPHGAGLPPHGQANFRRGPLLASLGMTWSVAAVPAGARSVGTLR